MEGGREQRRKIREGRREQIEGGRKKKEEK